MTYAGDDAADDRDAQYRSEQNVGDGANIHFTTPTGFANGPRDALIYFTIRDATRL